MSLVYCPECGHEVSVDAVACPGCGRPIAPPVVKKVVVMQPPPSEGFPPWAFAVVGLLGIAVIIGLIILFRQSGEQANTNVNVNMAQRRTTTEPVRDTRTSSVPPTESQPVSLPPSRTTTVPGTATSIPIAPPPDKGNVVINAKISPATGGTQAARNTKFYLLDKDIESILTEARIEPIEGNSLTASLGLAAVYPDRYGDFQRQAMRAIGAHAKFTGTTGSGGSANLSGIAPESYYLFAISRIGHGFALWNSPVSVTPGDNVLNLTPQSVTEIPESAG
ncbi:hypothetical protein BH10ACI2_BH10ACI2_19320 [soil metagenome]